MPVIAAIVICDIIAVINIFIIIMGHDCSLLLAFSYRTNNRLSFPIQM